MKEKYVSKFKSSVQDNNDYVLISQWKIVIFFMTRQ